MKKTFQEQIDSVSRELSMRRKAYPKWVKEGRMTQDKATHEIECMESVLDTLVLRRMLQEVSEEMKGEKV